MGPQRKHPRHSANQTREAGYATHHSVVRASSIFPSLPQAVGWMVDLFTLGNRRGIGNREAFAAWEVMPRWRKIACHIAPILTATFIGYIGFLATDRAEPTPVLNKYIIPTILHPGQVGTIHYTIRIERDCPGVVHRRLVDSLGVVFDLTDIPTVERVDIPLGSKFEFAREVPMPFGVAGGPIQYRAHTVHWCNWLQEWLWPIDKGVDVIDFKIDRGPNEPGPQGIQGIQGIPGPQGVPGTPAK